MENKRTIERPDIGIDEKLRWIEAMTATHVIRPMRPQRIAIARRDPGNESVKNTAAAHGQHDAFEFGIAGMSVQTQLDRGCVRRKYRHVDAVVPQRNAERLGTAGGYPSHHCSGRRAASSRKRVAYCFAGRVQPTSVAMPRSCRRRHVAASLRNATVRVIASSSWARVTGAN